MLPMGTIVTVCMFLGLIVASGLPLIKTLPTIVKKTVATLVLAGGLWNTLWYGLQHLTEFWGIAALVSGILMIITAMYVLSVHKLPSILVKAKPIVLFLLLGCALLYAITIARL